jgi:hypothetical protein
MCGHEHNFQAYTAATFARYLRSHHTHPGPPASSPHYFVAGSSGATLAGTGFKEGDFPSARYPGADRWSEAAAPGRRVLSGLGLDRTVAGQVAGRVAESFADDDDAAVFLSLLLVDVKPPSSRGARMSVVIRPALMDDLQDLFMSMPGSAIVDVTDPHPPVDRVEVDKCLERFPSVEL